MNPLCQTCTNIFNYPECCTENLEDSVKLITHCRNYSAGHKKDIPEVKLNPQTVKTLDEDWKPHYEFGEYFPECDVSGAYTITQSIIAKVADAQECACIEAIRIWAREKGYDDVLLLDENKLKEIKPILNTLAFLFVLVDCVGYCLRIHTHFISNLYIAPPCIFKSHDFTNINTLSAFLLRFFGF